MKKKEYEKCIKMDHADYPNLSWCKKEINFEFHFLNIDHAVFTRMNKDRLMICKNCAREIMKYLKEN